MSNFNHHANKKSWIISSIFTSFLTKWDAKLRKQNRQILLLLDNVHQIQI